MKIRSTILALTFALSLAMPAAAFAGGPEEWTKFFTQLEGRWEGNGFGQGMGGSGSVQLSMYVGRHGELPDWEMQINRSGGLAERSFTDFHIAGNFLSINDDNVQGASSISTSSANSLEYRIMSFGARGDFVDYVYSYDVSGDGMSGEVSVERNSTTIYRESFSVQRKR